MKPLLSVLLALFCLHLGVTSARAAEGGADGGGAGSTIHGIPWELFLLQNAIDLKKTGISGEAELKKIAELFPSLADRMSKIYQKQWIAVDTKDLRQLSERETGIPLPKQDVVYQNEKFVFVDRSWLKKASAQAKSVMLTHEFFQFIRISNAHNENGPDDFEGKEKIAPGAVPEINYAFLRGAPAPELQKLLVKHGFGIYGTKAEFAAADTFMRDLMPKIKKVCSGYKKTTSIQYWFQDTVTRRLLKTLIPLKQVQEDDDSSEFLVAEYHHAERRYLPHQNYLLSSYESWPNGEYRVPETLRPSKSEETESTCLALQEGRPAISKKKAEEMASEPLDDDKNENGSAQ